MTIFEVLAKRKTLQALKVYYLQDFVVPGAGIEPARIAPLVFETSASTDSAIRALRIGEVVPRLMPVHRRGNRYSKSVAGCLA